MNEFIETNIDAFNKLDITIIEEMVGVTFSRVERSTEDLCFFTSNGGYIKFYHDQDCCEMVEIDDVCGDLDDLLHTPILQAEEVSTREAAIRDLGCDDSHTWTFYKFATQNGEVTVRWFGSSNGYYSERVNIQVEL